MPRPKPQITGTIKDPDFRRRRGKHAAKIRNSLDTHLKHVVASAGELTPTQRTKLRAALNQKGSRSDE